MGDELVEIGRISITYEIAADGDTLTDVIVDGDIPIATQLGLLRLAEDTLLREAARDAG